MLSSPPEGWSYWPGEALLHVVLLAKGGLDAADQPLRVLPIVMGVVLGAFGGGLAGMVLARLLRFGAYMAGKSFEGKWLVMAGALAGAATLVWIGVR